MGSYPPGALLTCTHQDCGCRVRIEAECGCPATGDGYRCSCGAPLVPVEESTGGTGDPPTW